MLESEKSLVLPIHYSVSPSNISMNVTILTILKNGHSEIWLYEKLIKCNYCPALTQSHKSPFKNSRFYYLAKY